MSGWDKVGAALVWLLIIALILPLVILTLVSGWSLVIDLVQ